MIGGGRRRRRLATAVYIRCPQGTHHFPAATYISLDSREASEGGDLRWENPTRYVELLAADASSRRRGPGSARKCICEALLPENPQKNYQIWEAGAAPRPGVTQGLEDHHFLSLLR